QGSFLFFLDKKKNPDFYAASPVGTYRKKSQEQTMGSARLFRPAPRQHPAFFLVIKMGYRMVE
ncbi:MAG: hypothetical protein ABIN67_07100, partial [Ferruginibacter sp.]